MPTVISWGDPKAVTKWASKLVVDTARKSYWTRRGFIGSGDNHIIEQKTDLASDQGDTIQFDLSISLKGMPTAGDNTVDNTAEGLRFYTDEVKIDQIRKQVDAGGRMSRKRVVHDLRLVAKDRLSDYWRDFNDEINFIYLSGARGKNEGFKTPVDWTGHATNPIQAPDAAHIIRGGYRAASNLITAGDTMTRALIEGINTRAAMLNAADPDNADMVPIEIEGESHFAVVMSKYQEHDLRVADTTGWVQIQRDLAGALGKSSLLLKSGLGLIGDTILHSHKSVIRFDDYGAGANVPAARALFMGRQAGVIAYGSTGGARFEWIEEMKDAKSRPVVTAGIIFGVKKTRFNGRDFGVIAVDTAAKAPGS